MIKVTKPLGKPKSTKSFDEILLSNVRDIDPSAIIYRIFPLERFLQTLQTKQLVLSLPSTWEDPAESFFLKAIVHITKKNIDIRQTEAHYASCWTTLKECDGLWHRHSQNIGVRVSTTVKKLFSYLYDENNPLAEKCYFIGKVKYKTFSQIESFLAMAASRMFTDDSYFQEIESLLIKRRAFKYENEIRLIFRVPDITKPIEELPIFKDIKNPWIINDNLYRININPNELFDNVVFSPTTDRPLYRSLKAILVSLGYKGPVKRSLLYDKLSGKYSINI